MSGAVDFTKKAVEIGTAPMWAPVKAAVNLIKDGDNPIKDMGRSTRRVIGNSKDVVVDPLMEGLRGEQEPLNIAAPVDPAVKLEADKKERARVKRQAEIDILTDRPGRGGTILTDQFTYNV